MSNLLRQNSFTSYFSSNSPSNDSNNYNPYNGSSSSPEKPSSASSIPLTLSVLLADALFPEHLDISPSAAMLIPLKIINLPFAYFVIIILDLATALFAKWTSAYSGISPFSQYQQAYPNLQLYRQGNVRSSFQTTLSLNNSSSDNSGREPTPLFPVGLSVSLALSAPFSGDPNKVGSKFISIYGLEVLRIRHLPKTFIPLLTLFIYFYFYPKYGRKTSSTEQK